MGEYRSLKYESNYLFSNNTLFDYIYSIDNFKNNHKHKITLHKTLNQNLKYNLGIKFLNKFQSPGCFIKTKFLFSMNNSLETSIKFNKNELKLFAKLKERVNNLYFITSHKIIFDNYIPIYFSHNQIWYKYNNRFFKFGYFSNVDGYGIEVGYKWAGISISIPMILMKPDVNFHEEMEKSVSSFIFDIVKGILFFIAINYMSKFLVKKYPQSPSPDRYFLKLNFN